MGVTEEERSEMGMERIIRAIAGTFIMATVALGHWHCPYWYLFAAFVGANLFQSAFTRWCLMEDILAWLGVAREN
ncbi:MAG: DUF2892 domain-containing protein [Gemmatimonadota bacterium]|nr:DUF2892 domain-containing protein [Gemmatimonadota bacterium]